MLKKPELFINGYHLSYFPLSEEVRTLVSEERFEELDLIFKDLTSSEGALFKFIQKYHDISSIETMISLRDGSNECEEDGIWHDDGSRVFAFSLSLTLDEVQGGRLGIKQRGRENFNPVPTPSFVGISLFITRLSGCEHTSHQVTKGKRCIIVG